MSTSWNLTRYQIGLRALQKLRVVAGGETPRPEDLGLVYDSLDAILKELPIYGYAWPQMVSGQATLTLLAGVQATTLPTDYYHGSAIVSFIDASGNEQRLRLVTLVEWNDIQRKAYTGAYPEVGYIDNFNVLRTWPVQTVDRVAKLVYQQVIADTVTQEVTGLNQVWLKGIVYAVAEDAGDEFGISRDQMAIWNAKWSEARTRCIMSQTYPSPGQIGVDDGPSRSRGYPW